MKLLLVALNAKYIHSNLAVHSLRAYARKYSKHIGILELTINNSEEGILKAIYQEKAEVVAFSCYIWNISMVRKLSLELRKLCPKVKIWYGGPEVSYNAKECFAENKALNGIMLGEGEQTFLELAAYYIEAKGELEEINGLAFRENAKSLNGMILEASDTKVTITPPRQPLDIDNIPFPYENMEDFRHRIIYYESSRGCPFSCSYCLSSIEKGVRLRSSKLVRKELGLLMSHRVPQVKFVDRTFNCNRKHALDIWQFIKDNDNGITNFHFEIAADLLSEEELTFLKGLRPGLVQFEIGVQSTNPDTIKAIHRRMDLEQLKKNVARIKEGRNIHQHLDLIAGLPLEDEKAFTRSFDEVYLMQPDQLQLGFLKLLKGSSMEKESVSYGIISRDTPPYEVLYTNHMSYDGILRLKAVCEMVEIYYNSGQFVNSIHYLERYFSSPMGLYLGMGEFYEKKGYAFLSHNRMRRYEILLEFFREIILPANSEKEKEVEVLFPQLLILDLYLREDLKSRPAFAPEQPLKIKLQDICTAYGLKHKQIHVEQFTYDVIASVEQGKAVRRDMVLLFDYGCRDPLSKAAAIRRITL